MSYRATNWAYDMKLTGPAKPVLVALADMADDQASCYPGQERLASMTGLSVPTVARAIRRLETLGLLVRSRRFGPFGHRTSDRYHLQLTVSIPETLPITAPTRQRAYKAESQVLPITVISPTYQSDGVTISEPLDNHQSETTDEESVDNLCARQSANLGVDFWRVRTSVAKATNRVPDATDVLRIIIAVLDRATSEPTKPTAYVVKAIVNDWPEWQQLLDEAVAS
jgi:hypothetical protein